MICIFNTLSWELKYQEMDKHVAVFALHMGFVHINNPIE